MKTISSLVLIFIILRHTAISTNTLFPHQSLLGSQTLVSPGNRFEFGFFSPGSSGNRYLGIWYMNISPLTVVWIANRNTPLTDSSGVLNMDDYGNLRLQNQDGMVSWSSSLLKPRNLFIENPITTLLDSGNLVVTQSNEDGYIWQSFDHATDTILPGMKLGWDLETGVNNSLVSWRSAEDPSTGNYSLVMEPHNSPEIYLLREHNLIYRSGPWNGVQFSGVPEMKVDEGFKFTFVFNTNQKYYLYVVDESILSRVTLDESGTLRRLVWLGGGHGWVSYWDAPKDQCDDYKECGAYGVCNTINLPVCSCLKGFKPRNKMEWDFRETSGGCVRQTKYECGKDDGFLRFKKMKLPENSKAYFDHGMKLRECREMCKKNCSCTAYANSNIQNGGSGCIIWIGDLLDLREYPREGQDIYVRVADAELDHNNISEVIIITVIISSVTFVSLLIVFIIWKKKKMMQKRNEVQKVTRVKSQESQLFDMVFGEARDSSEILKSKELELQLIDFEVIVAITENFSQVNKLGQGGFGSVYKGTLASGQDIAVKRLCKSSGQGVDEFINEVLLIAKLQHRNLVRLKGCCINNEEKMLIYEYMPNKSLDSFLFDKTKRLFLDWPKRFNIIMGIARGLLYLHQDSRLRIIHRDLKASNILLDDEMNPKISDFGMARIFGGNQTEASTRRVVGTIGYMSPEYAMDGLFSVKSDVFSYGVLVLEIISGKKNKGFFSSTDELNILGYAWRLWVEGKVLELMDESLDSTSLITEVLKCIQVGLLCVQEHADDRPSISSVVMMLGTETATLPQPKQTGFSLGRLYSSPSDKETCSVNNVTLTVLDAR